MVELATVGAVVTPVYEGTREGTVSLCGRHLAGAIALGRGTQPALVS